MPGLFEYHQRSKHRINHYEMHALLGIDDYSWQSLYHFTVGGAVDDARISTLPPYEFQP